MRTLIHHPLLVVICEQEVRNEAWVNSLTLESQTKTIGTLEPIVLFWSNQNMAFNGSFSPKDNVVCLK